VKRSSKAGISAAAWFYSQSFASSAPTAPVADTRTCPDCGKPWGGVCDRWDAASGKWIVKAICCGARRAA
jgi:hypothetical protein